MRRLFGRKSIKYRNDTIATSSAEGGPFEPSNNEETCRVVDDNMHASDGKTKPNKQGHLFNMRGGWKVVHVLYAKLAVYEEIKSLIDNAGWSSLLSVAMPNSDQRFVESCVERWWDTTHTFHLPLVEIGITPYDFTFLTGISIGQGLPLPEYSDVAYRDETSTISRIFPGATFQSYLSGGIKSSDVVAYIEKAIEMVKAGIPVDPLVVARAFLFYTIGQLFFPNANSTICIGYLALVENLAIIGKYDWGSAILARVYHALDSCSRRSQRSMDCFWQLIEYFMYEYLHTSTPVLESVNTDYWPRVRRWARQERATMTRGIMRFKYPSHQQQLEMRSPDSICWRPYSDSEWNTTEMVQIAYGLSLHRVLLLDQGLGATWYLGDRCYRQLTGSIVIPRNPPTPMNKISRDEYLTHSANEWPRASLFITVATQSEYDDYWARVSRGAIVHPLTRYVNTDGIGYAALCSSQPRLPQPPMPDYSPGVCATQESSTTSQTFQRFDWVAEVAAPGGASMTISIAHPHTSTRPPLNANTNEQWRELYIDARDYARALQSTLYHETRLREDMINEKDVEIGRLQSALASNTNVYRPVPTYANMGESSTMGFSNQYMGDTPQPGISLCMDDEMITRNWDL